MSDSIKLAEYLFTRLRQLGIESIHGVPGDYNLELLDYVEPSGLSWIGNTNELNAAYAADGYARIKGISAVITTFGVGELSAINAIAGAYAEFAPVVHIVGTPSRSTQENRAQVHHTFNDGEYGRFGVISAQVTVARASLWAASTSAQEIDSVLRECLFHQRPVYIQIPADMVAASLPSKPLRKEISLSGSTSGEDGVPEIAITRIMDQFYRAKQPIIVADGECRLLGIVDEVQAFIDATKWPTWTTPFGKGLFKESCPYFHGIHKGSFNDPRAQDFIEKADLVINFGPHHSSSNTYGLTSIPNPEITISFTRGKLIIGTEDFRDVSTRHILSELNRRVDFSEVKSYDPYPDLPYEYSLSTFDSPSDQLISQDKLWRVLSIFLRQGDIVLGETGTAGYGVREMPLPPQARVFSPVTWLSIGYMLPAAQGAALAQRELAATYEHYRHSRTILFIGDGSFQMTVQELSTIIRHNLNVVVFIINNYGYTIERCIHGRNKSYNDVASWRYLEAPKFFGADEDTFRASASTWGELGSVLGSKALGEGKGLRMVEIMVSREDAPTGLLTRLLNIQKGKEE